MCFLYNAYSVLSLKKPDDLGHLLLFFSFLVAHFNWKVFFSRCWFSQFSPMIKTQPYVLWAIWKDFIRGNLSTINVSPQWSLSKVFPNIVFDVPRGMTKSAETYDITFARLQTRIVSATELWPVHFGQSKKHQKSYSNCIKETFWYSESFSL